MIRFALAAALAFALAATAPVGAAHASPDCGRGASAALAPGGAAVDAAGAIAAAQRAGYSAVTELEWECGAWQVKAADAQGVRATLRVDAATGAVSARRR